VCAVHAVFVGRIERKGRERSWKEEAYVHFDNHSRTATYLSVRRRPLTQAIHAQRTPLPSFPDPTSPSTPLWGSYPIAFPGICRLPGMAPGPLFSCVSDLDGTVSLYTSTSITITISFPLSTRIYVRFEGLGFMKRSCDRSSVALP